ncbi:MAG: ATP-dependent DNA helicase RecG [Candidatus Bipolaricaulota bacterium]
MDKKHKRKLKKILKLEKKTGFQNEAVLGGLESLSDSLIQDARIRELLDGYDEKKPFNRGEVVEEIENYIESSDTSTAESEVSLEDPIKNAAGVGDKREEKFLDLGVRTIRDLFFYFPRRIEDRRKVKKISEVSTGESCTVLGKVEGLSKLEPRPGVELVKAAINDGTGTVYPVWFNQPWIKNQLRQEDEVAVYGEVKREYGERQMENPTWEPAEEKSKTRKLVPVYPATEDLSQKVIRWIIRKNLIKYIDAVQQFPSSKTVKEHGFMERKTSFKRIHEPLETGDFEEARRSLSFSELFLFYTELLQESEEKKVETPQLSRLGDRLEEFRGKLSFDLTDDQERALGDLAEDLKAPEPMNRLLQGDVGTGKTVVAAAASYLVISSGYQVGMMAPTTVLAEQHYRNLENLFRDLSAEVELLTGDLSKKRRENVLSRLESGEIDLLVGTHALLEETVTFSSLNLVVIDEEQRFGVAQKEKLGWGNRTVNKLVLSATPIPRTITATVYGEYEVSRLEEFPHGEKDVSTYWISNSKRNQVYEYVKKELKGDSQAFIVLPLIEESDQQEVKSAIKTREELAEKQLKGFEIGLLHGRMKSEEKSEVLRRFEKRELDALVSTTVIEVGVDIPSANILIVEEADQFGLTQLHQLRGRIGRSGDKAYCFAIGSPTTEEGRERLEAFRDISDGFQLVEKDLEIRGPGDLLSSAQHGFHNSFRACNFLKDYDIMKVARDEARKRIELEGESGRLKELFEKYFGNRLAEVES